MTGTIKLEDMRLFAKVAETKSFTAAARILGVPKQTLSRRIAELERALGVRSSIERRGGFNRATWAQRTPRDARRWFASPTRRTARCPTPTSALAGPCA